MDPVHFTAARSIDTRHGSETRRIDAFYEAHGHEAFRRIAALRDGAIAAARRRRRGRRPGEASRSARPMLT